MGIDVFIFGIGCSGTTMTYSLLQSIFSKLYGVDYYSTYEPFIWSKEKFNCPYESAAGFFGKTSSMSVEGIFNHVTTPMFVNAASIDEYIGNRFFRHFSAAHGPGKPHLAKLIRANGRMSVFRALNPQARFLLMLRNPVDNINCAKNKFSFYGEDFYPSDYPRFCEQLEKENKLTLDNRNVGWAQKQAEYCYQMNRAAIEFAISDSNTRILEYDFFSRNKSTSAKALSDFLKVPITEDQVEMLHNPTGPVTGSLALSQAEYEAIFCYDDLYSDICERAGVRRGKSSAEVKDQYDGRCIANDINTDHQESTTNRLRHSIRALEDEIRHLKKCN